MKNNILKFYVVVFYFCSTFVLFAVPGTTDDTGTLENTDVATAPIDEYLWILGLIGLIFVFLRLKATHTKKILVK